MLDELTYFDRIGLLVRKVSSQTQCQNAPTKAVLFTYDSRLEFDLFSHIISRKFQTYNINDSTENDYASAIELLKQNSIEKRTSLLLISHREPYLVLISRENRKDFDQLLKELSQLYPFISRIYIRSNEIKILLSLIQSREGSSIIVKESILKRYYGDKEIERSWVEHIADFNEVFRKAKQEDIWVDSLRVSIVVKNIKGTLRINRKGVIQYEKGLDFLSLKSILLDELVNLRKKVIEHNLPRPRNLENFEVFPILFSLNEDVFKDAEDAKRLINRIQKNLKTWGYSVLLSEEGFIWLLLHDYASGSSYELMVTSKSEVVVIPQTQTSPISFNELLSFLINNYNGEVVCDIKQS